MTESETNDVKVMATGHSLSVVDSDGDFLYTAPVTNMAVRKKIETYLRDHGLRPSESSVRCFPWLGDIDW